MCSCFGDTLTKYGDYFTKAVLSERYRKHLHHAPLHHSIVRSLFLNITLLEMELAFPNSKVIYHPTRQMKDTALYRD